MIRRSSPPRRRSPLARSTTPIKKVNVVRKAKRRKSYAQKLAAYKRSETYKLVEARAAGQCEAMDVVMYTWTKRSGKMTPHRVPPYRCVADRRYRCRLTHHHKTYARFGGMELPEDIIVLCDRHNALVEAEHSTRNRNYSR